MYKKPKIGVLGFSDGDPEVHKQLRDIVKAQFNVIIDALRNSGEVELFEGSNLINSVGVAKEEAIRLSSYDVDGVIFVYGVFSFPNFTAVAAKNINKPILLASNLNPEWPGMVAMLAGGGALNHLGIKHFRIAGNIGEKDILNRILSFCRCARAASRLNGMTYGLIGGRSLGMYSSVVDMQQWQEKFGVDIEHIDQLEIVRISEEIPEWQVDMAFRWLSENIGKINYDNNRLTEEKLKTQIRHYEATKKIIKDKNLDFVGVKCHYELSRNYCTQCLSAAFMNDPYDWDGAKEPFVFACEADSDAALTMQILKLLTDYPVIFMDVRHYDKENNVMVFCNCGSQSTYYAGKSMDPKVNLKNVTLYPCLEIFSGGGAHINFMTKAGPATIARLNRYKDQYRMTIIPTEFVELPVEKMKETTEEWPHVFAKLPFDYEMFLESFAANHCHAVYGDYVEEIKKVCKMLNVETEVLA